MMDIKVNGEKNRLFFNEKIDEYDKTHATFMKTKASLALHLPSYANNILDLGVGTGLELIELFKKNPNIHITAIDISENMLKKLQERPFGKKIEIICGNFFFVDFKKDYDAVISTSALHHFFKEDKLELYKKIYNCLKEEGMFLNADKIASESEELKAIEEYNKNICNNRHIDTPLSIEHEVEILKKAGFQKVLVLPVDKDNYRLFKAYK